MLKSIWKRVFRHQVMRYLATGAGAVCMDYAVYELLSGGLGVPISPSKGISYISGAVFAYALGRMWTFGSRARVHVTLWRFAVLYAGTFGANVGINALVLFSGVPKPLAFCVATGTSIVLNYLGQKYWVFGGERGGGHE